MSQPYVGVCVGGPFAGKRMGAYDPEQKVAHSPRPLSVAEGFTADAFACSHGVYTFVENEWRWRELS